PTGSTAPTPTPPTCATPDARADRAYDAVVLPGVGTDDRRFWGGGIVAADLDGDGDLDLVAPGPVAVDLWWNDGHGGFVDGSAALAEVDGAFAAGGAAADVDADGDLDLVLTRWGGGATLLINDGDGGFADRGGLPRTADHLQSAAWGDLDGDGALDLVIAGHGAVVAEADQVVIPGPGDPTRLWLGDGAGGLIDATDRLDPRIRDGYSYVVGLARLDADRTLDLVVANDYPTWTPGLAAVHRGDRFVPDASLGLTVRAAGMGLALGDVNDDGVDDVLQPVWDDLVFRRSTGAGQWVDATDAAGCAVPQHVGGPWIGWGAEFADLDLDGDLDAVVAFGRLDAIADRTAGGGPTDNDLAQRFGVYLQQPDGGFVESAAALGLDRTGVWRGFVVADLTGDGWPDLARRDLDGGVVVDLARCGEAHWLQVAPWPPADAVGAEVALTVDGRTQHRTVRAGGTSLNAGGPPEVWFGLGAAGAVDGLTVIWPDGGQTELGPVDVDQRLIVSR
ncbi:MAG: FG-GAP-like repeat-containing protein, partial [Myxococcota bacterium]